LFVASFFWFIFIFRPALRHAHEGVFSQSHLFLSQIDFLQIWVLAKSAEPKDKDSGKLN